MRRSFPVTNEFLPISRRDMEKRGWNELDIIIVTGDAYVDHPSYGDAVIGRFLEDAGFRVGIIAQPDWRTADDFKRLGRPRLFFGVTAGNLDSMLARYTANKKLRSSDDYSPKGRNNLRPDRASIVYANKIREAFDNEAIILGGIEASMRRLAHYDYWSDTVKRSILLDSKADILVYGMGERQILEIAKKMNEGGQREDLVGIRGTVIARSGVGGLKNFIEIPSYEDVSADKTKFCAAFKTIFQECDPCRGKTIVQRHANRFLIQFPPALPLSTPEIDKIYGLNYVRSWHPVYDKDEGVPGFETVRFSVISHRGCPGGCNFCSLFFHQGRIVQSRSAESITSEVEKISKLKDFKGTITDIGGPTANLYDAACELWDTGGACSGKRCLVPAKCRNLKLGYNAIIDLWSRINRIPGIKHVFIGSGVRYDLLTDNQSDEYLKSLCSEHISGLLKVAPEHSERVILDLMGKPYFKAYDDFVRRFGTINDRLGKKQFLVHYLISAHPGSTLRDALNLSLALKERNIRAEQIQDFIPLPMTISGCMYYTQMNPFTGKKVYVAQGLRERRLQRALIQYWQPANRKIVLEALKKLGRIDLAKKFLR